MLFYVLGNKRRSSERFLHGLRSKPNEILISSNHATFFLFSAP